MPKSDTDQMPTFAMQPVRYVDGTWGVSVQVTGLESEMQAEAAMAHMEKLFCVTPQKTTCPTCEALARTVMMDQTGVA